MRVLVVSHALVVPANQALYCEMERLAGVELTLVVPERWRASVGGATQFERHADLRSTVVPLPVWLNGRIHAHLYRGLRAARLPQRPDVVYADEEAYSLAAWQCLRLARSLGLPLVFKTNQNLAKRYPPPFGWAEQRVHAYAAAALPCTADCGEVLRAKGYRNRTEVVGFGLDPTVCRPWPTEELRPRLGLPNDAFVVGFMGRMVPEKGALDAIEAALALTRRGVDVHLLMVGGGPQEAELRARAAELPAGRVVFAGMVSHGKAAAEHLSCMDVCVVPSRTTASWKEQFGRVIIEAMACGVPVVGSDSGNVPLLIEETGGGLVSPEGDVEALAERIETLIGDRDLARRLAGTGQEYVNREYCFRRLAERMVGVFRDVVEGR
ncbi:MAG: glycosyltransferase family 4 protein [Armatimonadetes bacterium]|nr:glycosyltransferase family 4 protein [Armatimonadota bacterium]